MSDQFGGGSPTAAPASGAPSESSQPAPAPAPPSAPDTVVPSSPAPDASPAPPSSAPGESKESLLSAVLAVVKPDPDADKVVLPGDGATPAPNEPQPDGTGSTDPSEGDLSEDPSKEEMERYHSRTRKRIDKLLEQRNDARREAEALRADAQVATGLRNYLHSNRIAKEDFSILLDLGAALQRGDFHTFYQGVRPYMDLAEEALGVRLPPDLAERVHQGHMTTETARLYAQERSARQTAEAQAQRTTQEMQQAHVQQNHQVLQQGVQQAVSAWEQSVRQTDPDYGHKQNAVKNLLWAVVQERGVPQTPDQAVSIAQEAYARANEMISQFAPRPRATAAVPSSVNRNNGATPEPKSMMEAALLGLSKAHRSA